MSPAEGATRRPIYQQQQAQRALVAWTGSASTPSLRALWWASHAAHLGNCACGCTNQARSALTSTTEAAYMSAHAWSLSMRCVSLRDVVAAIAACALTDLAPGVETHRSRGPEALHEAGNAAAASQASGGSECCHPQCQSQLAVERTPHVSLSVV